MLTKSDFRSYFAKCKKYIKFNPILNEIGINQSAFSKFMKNDFFDYEISINKLTLLYTAVNDVLSSLIA